MKIFIDNNIMLDAFLARQPFNEAAEQILTACAETHKVCLSANSLTDIFYFLRKLTSAATAKAAIRKSMELFEIIPVNEEDCQSALSLPIDDFEDALVVICAKKANADYIVTRDKEFLQIHSPIPTISPDDLLNLLDM